MRKPNFADHAKSILPLIASVGSIGYVAHLSHAGSSSASLEALGVAVGTGIFVNGLSAVCRLGNLRAKQAYREVLVNHDILRLVRNAWGEAALAALQAFVESRTQVSILNPPVSELFRKAIAKLKPEDFTGRDISIGTVRTAIEESRRWLLDQRSPEAALPYVVQDLQNGIVASILETLSAKLDPEESLPADLLDFLTGKGGVLEQLTIYTAFHLKTDQLAQTAVLHFTLQNISDSQSRLEKLCEIIHDAQNESGKAAIRALDRKINRQYRDLCSYFDRRFKEDYSPLLDPPFATHSGPTDFTFRARATKLVGRDSVMSALLEFMGDPRPGLWTVISGAAGNGKSRIAAELIEMVGRPEGPPGRWRAGFLRNGQEWLKSGATKWLRDADTLLVLDNAAEFDPAGLADFLVHLNTAGESVPHSHLRVILIDRLPPDKEMGVVARVTQDSSWPGEIEANRWRPKRADVFDLKPVEGTSAMEIACDWAGDSWTNEAEERIEQALQEDSELARPLFAALMGDCVREGALPQGTLNPIKVSSYALGRLFRPSNPELLEEAKYLWAVATACQGVDADHLLNRETLSELTGDKQWPVGRLRHLQARLRELTGSSRQQIQPLTPDFLGGLFVLEQLLALPAEARLSGADTMISFAWKRGLTPAAFVGRLASDFIGREKELAEATGATTKAVNELLSRFVLGGLRPEARKRDGARWVAYCAHLAHGNERAQLGVRFVKALESAYVGSPDKLAADLAIAWLGLALSGNTPYSKRLLARARQRIQELFVRHNSAELARWHAQALFNAVALGPYPAKWEGLVDRIGEIRTQHDTAEIAEMQARAIASAVALEPEQDQREKLAFRIGDIRRQHDTAEIAWVETQALVEVSKFDRDPTRREKLADRIGEIRRQHDGAETALCQARLLSYTCQFDADPVRREKLANRIGEIREKHNIPELALLQARVLRDVTAVERESVICKTLSDRIGEIRRQHNTGEIALVECQALVNATMCERDLGKRKKLASRIGEIRREHDYSGLALQEAKALIQVTAVETDPVRCKGLADQIAEIRREHDCSAIALEEAKALVQATAVEEDHIKGEKLANRIGEIRREYGFSDAAWECYYVDGTFFLRISREDGERGNPDPFVELTRKRVNATLALEQAKALVNATTREQDPGQCEKLADRIGAIAKEQDVVNQGCAAKIGLAQAEALVNASICEQEPGKRKNLAQRIGEIRREYNTAEIALMQAMVLVNATTREQDPGQCEELADRIGEIGREQDLQDQYFASEIALAQAQALVNASRCEQEPGKRKNLAERIGEIRREHDTAEVALMQANALLNAALSAQDSVYWKVVADLTAEIRREHDTAETARLQAVALLGSIAVEQDWEKGEKLANRIGDIRTEHNTAQIGLLQAWALLGASEMQQDPAKCHQLADRIGKIYNEYATSEMAFVQARALWSASQIEPDPVKCQRLAIRIDELLAIHGLTREELVNFQE